MLLIYLPNIICPHFIDTEFSSRMECHGGQHAWGGAGGGEMFQPSWVADPCQEQER